MSIDLDNTDFGTELISPEGTHLTMVVAGVDSRGPYVWLVPVGSNGLRTGQRPRKLHCDQTDGWILAAERARQIAEARDGADWCCEVHVGLDDDQLRALALASSAAQAVTS